MTDSLFEVGKPVRRDKVSISTVHAYHPKSAVVSVDLGRPGWVAQNKLLRLVVYECHAMNIFSTYTRNDCLPR